MKVVPQDIQKAFANATLADTRAAAAIRDYCNEHGATPEEVTAIAVRYGVYSGRIYANAEREKMRSMLHVYQGRSDTRTIPRDRITSAALGIFCPAELRELAAMLEKRAAYLQSAFASPGERHPPTNAESRADNFPPKICNENYDENSNGEEEV